MIYLKVHDAENGDILAMCDSKLIEKILSEGEIEINIKDYSDFYKGELLSMAAAKAAIKKNEIGSANIVGEESIKVALSHGLIDEESIKRVMKVPYAYAFRIK